MAVRTGRGIAAIEYPTGMNQNGDPSQAWIKVKPDGRIFLGLQRATQSGDVSRDIAVTIELALQSAPGGPVVLPPLPGPGPRLQDLLSDDPLKVTVRDGFDFWLDEESSNPEVKASLERANASVFPTVRLETASAAYWCRFPEKAHVRWVLGDDEDAALAALARLSRAGELTLGGPAEARFEDPESGQAVALRPRDWAEAYARTVRAAVDSWWFACRERGVAYHRITTDTPFGLALRAALVRPQLA